MFSKRSLILLYSIGLFVVVVAGEVLYLGLPRAPRAERLQTRYFQEEKEQWGKAIDSLGAKEAYRQFIKAYTGIEVGRAHAFAHIFGGLLYEREGLSGVGVCDDSFDYGCYHSFFGHAISEYGVSVINELDKQCIAALGTTTLGCQHGIGHGLLWYLGDDHLEDALKACTTLTWKGSTGGCSSGVFMEYNFHTMADPEGSSPREFDPAYPLSPCTEIISPYRQSCYFEIPQWWATIFNDDTNRSIELCRELGGTAERAACFQGVGNTMAITRLSTIEEIKGVCDTLNLPDRLMCRQGASWGLSADSERKVLSSEMCSDLPSDQNYLCKSSF